ncbi:electron transfer DM13 domain-containing protein [Phthorimaea operculella]|nr:electron transfer DM13 domain-containing protein [Phthorimaea operculella]
MFKLCVLVLALIAQDCSSQDEDGPYRGRFIGKINSYHHQVSGDVYAVDEWTLLLVDFNYDGTGEDTFFWAGDSGRPGPQGFIVPDQHGKTNILERYYNEEVRLTLPEGKRISRIKWFAIYDINTQNAFGDVYLPDEFESPAPLSIGPLSGTPAVSSQPVKILDAATILIPEFRYDGSGEQVFFWTGVGPQPSSRGQKLPDEYGYLEPIRAYRSEDIRIELPGSLTVFQVNWLAIYDAARKQILGSVLLPDLPNVPPALRVQHSHKTALPHCKQLHRDLQVAWEVFGNQITIQLAGNIEEKEYMAFGISGASDRSVMVGADVAVATYDAKLQRGLATDYNITDKAPCVSVLGVWKGVCRDDKLNPPGQDSNQVLTAVRDNGVTIVTYRRQLMPFEDMDREWPTDRPVAVVWAVGRLDADNSPSYHTLFPRNDVILNLSKATPDDDCFSFAVGKRAIPQPWETAQLFDPALRVFRFSIGPAANRRGLWGRGKAAPSVAWYVNGQLAPDLQIRRGLIYTFKVYGGNDPHSATDYHPLIVTAEPRGGLERLSEKEQRAAKVLAGVHYTRRGRLSPTTAGPLCLATRSPSADPRRDDDYTTFRAFNRSLTWTCPDQPAAELKIAPNTSWPDVVYYHSFTHADPTWTCFDQPAAELKIAPNTSWPDVVYYHSFTHADPHMDCPDQPAAELKIAPNTSWPDVVYYHSFTHAGKRAFNRSLTWTCPDQPAAELKIAPNTSWPDVVYYHSFTHAETPDQPAAELKIAPNTSWPDVVYYHSFTHAGKRSLETITSH